ncbi:hypothetical protein ACFPRL_07070 [Pseudoclavibacter helvolus]
MNEQPTREEGVRSGIAHPTESFAVTGGEHFERQPSLASAQLFGVGTQDERIVDAQLGDLHARRLPGWTREACALNVVRRICSPPPCCPAPSVRLLNGGSPA